jgi:hypothetical protein
MRQEENAMHACLSFSIVVLAALGQPVFASEPCCNAVGFQTFDVNDVAIQLVEVKRTGPDDITVKWQIQNKSKTPQKFDKMGGWAAYQLVWDAQVLDLATRTKYPIAREEKTQTPVAGKYETTAARGIGLDQGKTLSTWAKFLVPASVTKVTVTLPGASEPWENVAITQ